MSVLIIGAAGAVGSQLTRSILRRRGPGSVIAADRRLAKGHRSPMPPDIADLVVNGYGHEGKGIDIRDEASIDAVLKEHKSTVEVVWNLAAPLSVETAMDPAVAHDITVGGMERLCRACDTHGVPRICFTDSIGSFGASAPRQGATARWLTENLDQDPGSDYGVQKRGCRKVLREWGGDSRWAVLPGVLHADSTWGKGTTEYALDAMLCAAEGREFVCPVPEDVQLPMIYRDDLIRGLVGLMDAEREELEEPESGYALAGFSFSAAELFKLIATLEPTFSWVPSGDDTGPAARFARLWPDSISGVEAKRDLGFSPRVSLEAAVTKIMREHRRRLRPFRREQKSLSMAFFGPSSEAP
mmetsp:Transcript_12198/g.28995  ORF Transcript_12198/g.28995 Transcript_12198/m.28995 type:complete len:356 (+) Transcript_12198:54-1121(+)